MSLENIRLRCFGKLALYHEGRPYRIIQKKAAELLAYLACHNGGPASKLKVAQVLWPQVDQIQSRDSLYKVCRYLKGLSSQGIVPTLHITSGVASPR